MSDNNSPRVFRQIFVDGNGGEITVKANQQRTGKVHVYVVTRDGLVTKNSDTEDCPDREAALACCDRVVANLLQLGWRPKSQRARAGTFSLTELPAPKKAA